MKSLRNTLGAIAVLVIGAAAPFLGGERLAVADAESPATGGTTKATGGTVTTAGGTATPAAPAVTAERATAAASDKARKGRPRRPELPAALRGVPERIIERAGHTLSFNRELNEPNWVAWELTAAETDGATSRSDNFQPDPDVPEPHRVTTDDYRGSGYDRGHMAPAADMKWSARAMTECFYMSNICPQNHSLNSGPWATLESACRRWAGREGSVYIVCGPVFRSGRVRTIGRAHRIAVPDGFFKVVLSLAAGREKAIGFYYANRAGKQPMEAAVMTVDEVERLTGMDFFVQVPDAIEDRVEATASLREWQ